MLAHDLRGVVNHNPGSNFSSLLFSLILKADHHNLKKIRKEYPIEVLMVEIFRTGRLNEDWFAIEAEAITTHSRRS